MLVRIFQRCENERSYSARYFREIVGQSCGPDDDKTAARRWRRYRAARIYGGDSPIYHVLPWILSCLGSRSLYFASVLPFGRSFFTSNIVRHIAFVVFNRTSISPMERSFSHFFHQANRRLSYRRANKKTKKQKINK